MVLAIIWLVAELGPTGFEQQTVELRPISRRRHTTEREAGDESGLFNALNAERLKRGLARLTLSTRLSNAARSHSTEMANESYFGHTSPSGLTCFQRMVRFGVRVDGNYAGENIALDIDAAHAESAMMGSPGNPENMLDPRYKKVGIAVVQDQDGTRYYAEDFLGDTNGYVSVARARRSTISHEGMVAATRNSPADGQSHQVTLMRRLPLQASIRN